MTFDKRKGTFRVTLVLDRKVDNWFILKLLSLPEVEGKDRRVILGKDVIDLLRCHQTYISLLSNGDRIVNLYFLTQADRDYRELVKVLEDLDKGGIGWVVFD